MAGRVQVIGGKLYFSSDTAGAGAYGTSSPAAFGGGAAIKAGGELWFPVDPAKPAAPATAPTAAIAAAPSIAPVLDNNVSVSVYGRVIPISAGKRRLPGDLIWLRHDQLNTEGQYTANAAYSFGYRLIAGATCNLVKVWANGVVIYDATSGFTAEGFTFDFYDGSQTAICPEMAADKGADITPAYKEQIYIRGIFPTKEFNGSLPNISALVEDDPAGFRQFLPWTRTGSGETLNPDDCSVNIALSNGDRTAERILPNPPPPRHFYGVRGTRGREANQEDGHGWFVFEAVNDHVTGTFAETGLAIFPEEYQGPGLASAAFDIEGGIAGDASSLYATVLGATAYNDVRTGVVAAVLMPEGKAVMFAVRLDVMKLWKGADGEFYGWYPTNASGDQDPITNVGGFDLGYLSGQGLIYPAWFSLFFGATGSVNFTGPFENVIPGMSSHGTPGSASTLTEVIVAVAARCGLDASDFRFVGLDGIHVTGIVITTDTDFLSFLKNSARVYGFDYTESGGQILCRKAVVGRTYTVDVGDIPQSALIPTSSDAAVTTTRDNSHHPEIIELAYQDETIDFQPSVQRARIPRVRTPQTDSFAIPYVMSAQEAITGAATALYREHYARVSHAFQLPFQYQRIEPTDLITFTSSGKALTVKVSNVVRNSDLSVKITAINLLTAEAEPVVDEFSGENYLDYRGAGYSGDPNINRPPLEIPKVVITSAATFSVVEGVTAVATLAATGGTPPYTWTKTGGADATAFTLTTGGVLTFTSAPDFGTPTDADANNVYLVNVKAASPGAYFGTQSIAVTVTAIPPVVITSAAAFTIPENTTAVATLTAVGGDGGPYTWTKTGGADTAQFTLTTGGVLSFTSAPDFETPTDADANNIYLVQVQASDGVRTTTQNIAVTVTNVGELFTGMIFSSADNSGYVIFFEDI